MITGATETMQKAKLSAGDQQLGSSVRDFLIGPVCKQMV